MGNVKWARVNFNLTCVWWTDLVTLTLKGLEAEHLRLNGGPSPAKVLLTYDWVAQVACLADSKGLLHAQEASLVSSVFLMRFQSENSEVVAWSPN